MIRLSQNPTAEQAQAVAAAGHGALVQHPRAGNRAGRAKIGRQLGALGVPTEVVSTIGWVTSSGLEIVDEPDRIPVADVTPEQWAAAGFELREQSHE